MGLCHASVRDSLTWRFKRALTSSQESFILVAFVSKLMTIQIGIAYCMWSCSCAARQFDKAHGLLKMPGINHRPLNSHHRLCFRHSTLRNILVCLHDMHLAKLARGCKLCSRPCQEWHISSLLPVRLSLQSPFSANSSTSQQLLPAITARYCSWTWSSRHGRGSERQAQCKSRLEVWHPEHCFKPGSIVLPRLSWLKVTPPLHGSLIISDT